MHNDFVHLHVHSEYSLLDGACRIKRLVSSLKKKGQTAVAITDHGVMYGCIEFYQECLREGIKPIIGCEVYVAPRGRLRKESKLDLSPYHLVLLCKNNIGYQNLIKLVSDAHITGFYNRPRCDKETLRKYSEGLIALSGCIAGEIPRMLLDGKYDDAVSAAREYQDIFGKGNFFIEVQNHFLDEEKEVLPLLNRISKELDIPIVATNDAHYVEKSDADMQRVLMAISTNTVIEKGFGFKTDEFYLKSYDEMRELFPEKALKATSEIAERCNVSFIFGVSRLPLFQKQGVSDNHKFLVDSVYEGLKRHYGEELPKEVTLRADYELSIITEMGFVDYFLIVADFIQYAKSRDIPVGPGRGSGVGSICAYALGITAVDPLRFNLLFERFLNPERISMPDFDIDFCYIRRGEVIDYVTEKYGKEHVAQIITFGTMAARSAVRDSARTMGLPYAKGDTVAKLIPFSIHPSLARSMETQKELRALYDSDPEVHSLIDTAMKIEGMPRHGSVHAAGIVITREPVTDYVPLQKSGDDVITQYTMGYLEQLGLLKMDFLGLRYLTVIHNTAKNVSVDITKIPEDDSNVYQMLSNGGTSGIFQFESEGMTSVLMRLVPETLEDLIATISLYRPGPMQSIPRYIENRHNPEKITYKHELLRDILEVTYGCIVYQEQVMEICRKLANFSYGKADLVRRAMSKKKHDVMQSERENFIKGAEQNGVPKEAAESIFEDIAGFATYAFNKSHAAAYAYLAYQTAYLRYYHYKEYMTELMTSVLENHSKLLEYKADIEKNGLTLLPPDINKSFLGFSTEEEGIRYGLLAIKNLGSNVIEQIIAERQNGEFVSLSDFCKRLQGSDVQKRAVESLIKSGAFDCFPHNRRSMLLVYEDIMSSYSVSRSRNIDGQMSLFDTEEIAEPSDKEIELVPEFSKTQLMQMEKESIGFYISGHPLDRFEQYAELNGFLKIGTILKRCSDENKTLRHGDNVQIIGILTKRKRHVTKSNSTMCFSEFEDSIGSIEVIVFPEVYEKNALVLSADEIFAVYASVSANESEEPKLIANRLERLTESNIQPYETVFVNLATEDPAIIAEIARIANRHSGTEAIRLCFKDTKTVKTLGNSGGVKITKDFLNTLTKLCGKENIMLK